MAEMWTRSPIMQGNTEQQQLTLISQLCGSITSEVWPGVEALDLFNKMELPRGQKRKVNKDTTNDYIGCIVFSSDELCHQSFKNCFIFKQSKEINNSEL